MGTIVPKLIGVLVLGTFIDCNIHSSSIGLLEIK